MMRASVTFKLTYTVLAHLDRKMAHYEPADFARKIDEARPQFKQGMPVDRDLIRPIVLESWERSRAYGLSFDAVQKNFLSEPELLNCIKERRTLSILQYQSWRACHLSIVKFKVGAQFLRLVLNRRVSGGLPISISISISIFIFL